MTTSSRPVRSGPPTITPPSIKAEQTEKRTKSFSLASVLAFGAFMLALGVILALLVQYTGDDPVRSAVTEQVEMGVAVRMACLDVLTRKRRGVEGWQ